MSDETRYTWTITVGGGYGSFEFTGTEAEAEQRRRQKARWEGAAARKTRGASVLVVAMVLLMGAMAHAAAPEPYTIDTVTGLESRTVESSLYDAVLRMVRPVSRANNFTEAEEECAKATAAQRLLEVTREAVGNSIINRLGGHEKAQEHFKRGDDDWCNKSDGRRGAEVLAPYLSKARSFLRPFLSEKLEELRGISAKPLTPAQVTAVIIAALVTMPVWALP